MMTLYSFSGGRWGCRTLGIRRGGQRERSGRWTPSPACLR